MRSILYMFQANIFDPEKFFSELLYIIIQGVLQLIDVLIKAFIFLCGGRAEGNQPKKKEPREGAKIVLQ